MENNTSYLWRSLFGHTDESTENLYRNSRRIGITISILKFVMIAAMSANPMTAPVIIGSAVIGAIAAAVSIIAGFIVKGSEIRSRESRQELKQMMKEYLSPKVGIQSETKASEMQRENPRCCQDTLNGKRSSTRKQVSFAPSTWTVRT